jgi:hypothetical protein
MTYQCCANIHNEPTFDTPSMHILPVLITFPATVTNMKLTNMIGGVRAEGHAILNTRVGRPQGCSDILEKRKTFCP